MRRMPARSSPRPIACSATPDAVARLEQWVAHYFGDTAPGAATARFHAAIGAAHGGVGRVARRAPRDDDDDEDAEPDEAELDD